MLPEHVVRPDVLGGREVALGEAALPSHRGLVASQLRPVPRAGGG